MVYEFKFPDVGEGITEGELISWLVDEGDEIDEDQSVAEVQTDKAVVEIPAPTTGTVKELKVEEGTTVKLNEVIMEIDTGEDGEEKEESEEKEDEEEQSSPTQESPTTSQDSKEPKTTSSTDVLALPKVRKYARENNIDLSQVKGSGKEGRIQMSDVKDAPEQDREKEKETKPVEPSEKDVDTSPERERIDVSQNVTASPSTRRYARKKGVDISGIAKEGTITKGDIDAYLSDDKEETSKKRQKHTVTEDPVREAIKNHMMESKDKTAQVTIFEEAEVSELVALRNKWKNAYDVKLTYLPFFIKAASTALNDHPKLNAVYDEGFVEKDEVNMGVAVDTDKGLMVPILQRADQKSVVDIAEDVRELAEKARDQNLSQDEMEGGTFTISSIGSIAGTKFTQILNYPEMAILGVGRIKDEPVVKHGEVVPGNVLDLSVTVDHRYIDGADAARFVKSIKEYLENPEKLFMVMK